MKLCIFGDAQSPHIQSLSPHLAALGVEVHVVCHKPVPVRGATVEHFDVPAAGLTRPHRWPARHINHLKDYMRRFDVVNLHFLHDWGFTPEVIEKGCFVATPWGSDIVQPPGESPPSEELVAKRVELLRHASGVTAFGPAFAKKISNYAQLKTERIGLAPLGVNLELFTREISVPRRVTADYRVGFFKGFREVYGAADLVRAIAHIVEALPSTRFDMIGDGPDLSKCQMLASELGIDPYIQWIPRMPQESLPQYLARWDLTAIPSICESFGAAALEAGAMELPVVASDVYGLRDTVQHDKTGWLVPPSKPKLLAGAIITLLGDRTTRERMAKNGRALVEKKYDWRMVSKQWVAAYEKARDRTVAMV